LQLPSEQTTVGQLTVSQALFLNGLSDMQSDPRSTHVRTKTRLLFIGVPPAKLCDDNSKTIIESRKLSIQLKCSFQMICHCCCRDPCGKDLDSASFSCAGEIFTWPL